MGYEQSILSQINQLRDVLQRYHGFAVIRELCRTPMMPGQLASIWVG